MKKNAITPKGTFISKRESIMLRGFAVSLMVWHHLFGFPERIHSPYVLIFDSLFHIETIAAYFGRICIAMFAFCSGYGMEKKAVSSEITGLHGLAYHYRCVITQLCKFFSVFWMVCIAFIPPAFLLDLHPIQADTVIKTFLGQSYAYNAEWWYIGYYVQFMLLFPLISASFNWINTKNPLLLPAGIIIYLFAQTIFPPDDSRHIFSPVMLYFVEGMFFVQTGWFERIMLHLTKPWLRFMTGSLLIIAVFIMRTLGIADHWSVPLIVFGFVLLLKSPAFSKYLGPIFLKIGKYSTYIWLTHTFFAYYYFQDFTYAPRYSWLIAVWCILLCMFCGHILEKIRTAVGVGIRKVRQSNV